MIYFFLECYFEDFVVEVWVFCAYPGKEAQEGGDDMGIDLNSWCSIETLNFIKIIPKISDSFIYISLPQRREVGISCIFLKILKIIEHCNWSSRANSNFENIINLPTSFLIKFVEFKHLSFQNEETSIQGNAVMLASIDCSEFLEQLENVNKKYGEKSYIVHKKVCKGAISFRGIHFMEI